MKAPQQIQQVVHHVVENPNWWVPIVAAIISVIGVIIGIIVRRKK